MAHDGALFSPTRKGAFFDGESIDEDIEDELLPKKGAALSHVVSRHLLGRAYRTLWWGVCILSEASGLHMLCKVSAAHLLGTAKGQSAAHL